MNDKSDQFQVVNDGVVDVIAAYCNIPKKSNNEFITNIVFSFMCFISILGLLITFGVYSLIPDFRNLHGKIVLNNVAAMMILTIYFLMVLNMHNHPVSCTFLGFLGYFSSLSMFVWMTVMSLDLCLTFSKSELSSNRSDSFKLATYCIIGWGAPLLLTVILIFLHYYVNPCSHLYPGVGDKRCFINGSQYSSLILFFIPMMVILILNMLVFTTMVVKLVLAKIETRAVRMSTRNNQNSGGQNHSSSSDLKDQMVGN